MRFVFLDLVLFFILDLVLFFILDLVLFFIFDLVLFFILDLVLFFMQATVQMRMYVYKRVAVGWMSFLLHGGVLYVILFNCMLWC